MDFKKYVLLIFCVISMTTIDIQTFDNDHKVKQIHQKMRQAVSVDDIIALEEQVIKLPILNDLTSPGVALQYSLPNYLNYLVSNLYDFDKHQIIFQQIYGHQILSLLKKVIENQPDQRIRDRDIQTIEVLTRYGFNWKLYLQELSKQDSYAAQLIRNSLQENPDLYNAIYMPRPGPGRLYSIKIPYKDPEQTWWDRTKKAWNNVKAEIPKIIDRMPQ